MEPVIVIGRPDKCDPYTSLNGCESEDDNCTHSEPGMDDPEFVGVMGCSDDGPGDPDGGGAPQPPPSGDPDETACDPRTDPDCEKPLTGTDQTTIATALANHVRPAAEIADTTARRRCQEMLSRFNQSLAEGTVFRGGSNTSHYGAMFNNRIHFDPHYLDLAATGDATALREMANTALHEAAHVLNYDHPGGATWVGDQDYYSDAPFDLLSPGPNSCIVY